MNTTPEREPIRPAFYTTAEAATRLNLSMNRTRQLLREQGIKPVQFGKKFLIPVKPFEAMLDSMMG